MPSIKTNKSAATTARVPKTIGVTVRLSPAQYERFAAGTEDSSADIGELLLALACHQLKCHVVDYDGVEEEHLQSMLWEYAVCGKAPEVAEAWLKAGFYTQSELAAHKARKEAHHA